MTKFKNLTTKIFKDAVAREVTALGDTLNCAYKDSADEDFRILFHELKDLEAKILNKLGEIK